MNVINTAIIIYNSLEYKSFKFLLILFKKKPKKSKKIVNLIEFLESINELKIFFGKKEFEFSLLYSYDYIDLEEHE